MTDPHPPRNRATRRTGLQPATGPSGTSRAGRRDTDRPRPDQTNVLQRLRTPILGLFVVAVMAAVGLLVVGSASSPAYACTTVDTVRPSAPGELGQIQDNLGAGHVENGDKVTYQVCPPASGKHLNKVGFGPLEPRVYGPDDQSAPNGWVHNLEHGGLVLLYSCEKGACDDAGLAALTSFTAGFPASAICALPAGLVGPVVARFEQMPTRYAALIWNRVLYLDTLNMTTVYDFYLRYGERLRDDGTWLAPPEAQCTAPTPSTAPGG